MVSIIDLERNVTSSGRYTQNKRNLRVKMIWFQVMRDIWGIGAKVQMQIQVKFWVHIDGNKQSYVLSLKLECLHTSWFHNSRLSHSKLSLGIGISHLKGLF